MPKTQEILKTSPLNKYLNIAIAVCIFYGVSSCSNDDDPDSNNGIPTITSISPLEGRIGQTISVKGSNFAPYPQDNEVYFNGVRAEVYVGIREELLVRVPLEASTGPISVFVPGFDTVQGPMFTVERIASITLTSLYSAGSGQVNRFIFDQAGGVSGETLFSGNNSLSLGGLEVDIIGEKIYLVNRQLGVPLIFSLSLDGMELDTLYDSTDPELVLAGDEPQRLTRIALDLEEEHLYVADVSGKILQGNLDGTQPLRVIYDDGEGYNTAPFGIGMAIGSKYIYWVETISAQILRIAANGSGTAEVLYNGSNGLMQPFEVVIDEASNRIIISDNPGLQGGENVDRILQGNLDGSGELETLFEGDPDLVVNPEFGLALDVSNNLLYWAGRSVSGADDFVLVQVNLSQEDPRPSIIADQNDIPGFSYFTIVVTEEGGSNGRLRARVGG